MGLEVVVRREDAGADELLLEYVDEVEEALGSAVADVVDLVGRDGKSVCAFLLLGGVLHHTEDAFDYVVDVGEVAAAVAVVEYLDGPAFAELVGEAEVGHIGAAGGTIDGEEAEAGAGDVVEFAVCVGQEFVALLGGGVEADGIVDLVVGGEGNLGVAAVDAAGAGVDQVLDWMAAAGFEDVVEADEVALDVGVGVGDGVADAGLRGEVDDYVRLMLVEDFVDERFIREVALDEGPGAEGFDFPQAGELDVDVVVVVDGVEADDSGCREILEEALDEVGADESGCAGHEDSLAFAEVYVVVEHCVFWGKDIRFASACPIDKQQKRLGEIFS